MSKILLLILALFLVTSCGSKKLSHENILEKEKPAKNSIEFTPEQIELAEIKSGKLKKRELSEYIECTGEIKVQPQYHATITVPIGGFVKNLYHHFGDYVKKGTILAQLEHPDYIKLQQNFLETKSQLNYLEEEFKRQGELTLDQAASIKKMQKAQASYKATESKMRALKAQLNFIGIDSKNLEKKGIVSFINIYSPINGYVSNMNANIGKYIDLNTYIYEIIDKSQLYLNLNIFEKDILKIRKGQKIIYNTINNDTMSFISEVNIIGQKIDEEKHAINIHGEIDNKQLNFVPGMYVNAKIYLKKNNVWSLPITSIIQEGKNKYVFIHNKNVFQKTKIDFGVELENFIEIKKAQKLLDKNIVIKGAYYLNAELNKETE